MKRFLIPKEGATVRFLPAEGEHFFPVFLPGDTAFAFFQCKTNCPVCAIFREIREEAEALSRWEGEGGRA